MYYITQSTIITSPIGFNIGLTNVDTRLKQRCINVVSTLFQHRALTFYQRCAKLKIRRRILFHFQRRINVISTLIHNVVTTLIRRWNVCWELIIFYQLRDLRSLYFKLICCSYWSLYVWNHYNNPSENYVTWTYLFL